MRLIDADKVDMPIMQRKDNEWVFRFNIKEALDTLPTVKAIPIEWIKEWQNRNEWKYESYFTMRDGVPKYAIECMIEDWVKENG